MILNEALVIFMMYNILIVFFMILLTGCSSKYKLFYEDRTDIIDSRSKSNDSGFLNVIFPKDEENLNTKKHNDLLNQEYPLNFSYASKILPGDQLTINVYNNSRKISLQSIYDELDSKQSKKEYVVDIDGTLFLPMLNEIRFEGLTEYQASTLLTQEYKRYLTNPIVKVRIANKRVYLLGEAGGKIIPISSNTVSLYEILAKAGGLPASAKKNAIQVISGELGAQKSRIIDMTKMSSINASNLMITANSIVYIQPRAMRTFNIAVGDFTSVMGLLTNTLGSYLSIEYFLNERSK